MSAWTVAVVGLLLSLAAFWLVQRQLEAHKLLEFKWLAENRHRALHKEIDNNLEAVESVRDLFRVSESVTEEDFGTLAQSLLARYPGIQALAWIPQSSSGRAPPAPRLGPSEKSQLQTFAGRSQAGIVQGEPDYIRFAEAYLASRQGDEASLELDSSASEVSRELLERARDSGSMVVSPRIALQEEAGQKFGFKAFMPVYGTWAGGPVQGRQRYPLGYAMGFFRIADIARFATTVLEPRGVEFLIVDQSAPTELRYLDFYSSRLSQPSLASPDDWLTWPGDRELQLTLPLRLADREWSVTYAPTAEYRSAEGFQQGPWVVLASGLLLTVLLTLNLLRIDHDVRARTRIEDALREREELFRQMTEAIQEVFWIQTPDCSRILYVSPAYEAIWGRSCESLYREPLSFLEGIHPDDREAIVSSIGQTPETETEQVFRVIRQDGTLRWVRSRAFIVRNHLGEVYRIAGIREDITEIKEAEQALRKSEQQLRSLFYQLPDLIKTVDHKGKIRSMSRALPNLSLEEAVGKNSIDLFPPEYRKRYWKGLKRAFRKGKIDHFQYATPESFWWDVRIVPIRRDGDVIEAMVIDTDVTETKKAQTQAIRNARLASLGVLAASVAHEINNPNNAIQFNASVLARISKEMRPLIEKYREENGDFVLGGMPVDKALDTLPRLISGITNGSLRIQKIVGNLKHMSRQDEGELSHEVDIVEVLQAAVSILRNQIQKHTDRFELQLQDNLPYIKGNAQQLEQVFINIILNALQSLTDRTQSILVSGQLDRQRENVVVIVQDEGRGIPSQQMGKVTEPFFTTRGDSGGTGLGLSISDTIIRNHKGRIQLSSESGSGTRVIVRLPIGQFSNESD